MDHKISKGALLSRLLLGLATLLVSVTRSAASDLGHTCHIQVKMANGSEVGDHILVEVFNGSNKIARTIIGRDGAGDIHNLPNGRFRIQIMARGSGVANIGNLEVADEVLCIYPVLLGGTVIGNKLFDTKLVSTAELQLSQSDKKLFNKGWMALQTGKLPDAQELFVELTKRCPNLARAYTLLGVIDELNGNIAAAEAALQQAVTLDVKNRVALFDLAEFLVRQNQFASAAALLDKPSSQMDAAEIHYLRALAYANVGRFRGATVEAAAVHRLAHRQMARVHLISAYSFRKLEEPSAAVREYELYVTETEVSSRSVMR